MESIPQFFKLCCGLNAPQYPLSWTNYGNSLLCKYERKLRRVCEPHVHMKKDRQEIRSSAFPSVMLWIYWQMMRKMATARSGEAGGLGVVVVGLLGMGGVYCNTLPTTSQTGAGSSPLSLLQSYLILHIVLFLFHFLLLVSIQLLPRYYCVVELKQFILPVVYCWHLQYLSKKLILPAAAWPLERCVCVLEVPGTLEHTLAILVNESDFWILNMSPFVKYTYLY